MRGMSAVGERQRDDREFPADSFNQDAGHKRVAYSQRPFVDRVNGGWCNYDGIGWRERVWFGRILVVAPYRVTRQFRNADSSRNRIAEGVASTQSPAPLMNPPV